LKGSARMPSVLPVEFLRRTLKSVKTSSFLVLSVLLSIVGHAKMQTR
jgi:hypothetical protein